MSDDLPPDWLLVSLAEVADARLGKMLDRSKHTKGQSLPYLRNVNVRWGSVDVADTLEMLFEDDELDRYGLLPGDVLICEGGEPGRAAIWSGEIPAMKYQKALHRIRPSVRLDPRWLVHHLKADAQCGRLARYLTGTTIKHFTGASLSRYELRLPPIAEQRRIVAKLEELTARSQQAKEALDTVPTLLDQLRQSVLAAAFGGGILPSRGTRRAHLSNWRLSQLDTLLTDIRYGTAAKCDRDASKTPVLRIPNIRGGSIDSSDLKFATLPEAERSTLELNAGDLLMVRSNGSIDLVGSTALVTTKEKGYIFAGYLIRLRIDQAKVRPDYMRHVLASPRVRSHIRSMARSSSGVHNINTQEIRSIPIPIAPLEDQEGVVRRTTNLLAIVDRLEQRYSDCRQSLAHLESSLLRTALAGRLVEPESIHGTNTIDAVTPREYEDVLIHQRSSPVESSVPYKAQNDATLGPLAVVLRECSDWISAEDAFARCGIGKDSTTEQVQQLYTQLRQLERLGRVVIEPVRSEDGRKLHDRLKGV